MNTSLKLVEQQQLIVFIGVIVFGLFLFWVLFKFIKVLILLEKELKRRNKENQ